MNLIRNTNDGEKDYSILMIMVKELTKYNLKIILDFQVAV